MTKPIALGWDSLVTSRPDSEGEGSPAHSPGRRAQRTAPARRMAPNCHPPAPHRPGHSFATTHAPRVAAGRHRLQRTPEPALPTSHPAPRGAKLLSSKPGPAQSRDTCLLNTHSRSGSRHREHRAHREHTERPRPARSSQLGPRRAVATNRCCPGSPAPRETPASPRGPLPRRADPPGGGCPFTAAGGGACFVHGFTLGGGASTKSRRPPSSPSLPAGASVAAGGRGLSRSAPSRLGLAQAGLGLRTLPSGSPPPSLGPGSAWASGTGFFLARPCSSACSRAAPAGSSGST